MRRSWRSSKRVSRRERIHQDLIAEHGAQVSYWSVRRYVAKLSGARPLPFRRLETPPGEEAQVDFGTGAWVVTDDGKRRRPWIFRIVLSHSRKAYSEVVWRQTTDNFIACLENAFHFFGGAVERLVIDNLKAAVPQADWYDRLADAGQSAVARQPQEQIVP